MRRFPPGFGSAGGLNLGHNPLDVNAGVGTSHLRLAQERVAARLAAAVVPVAPRKASTPAKPKEGSDD
ncbi:hypothetical protein D3C72_257540 [compost metagenome]